MAWTAPKTWTVGEFVTKAMLDEQIKENMVYLKGEADKHATVTLSDVTSSRAIGTVYQNTSGKIMLVSIEAGCSASGAGDASYVYAATGASNPPTMKVSGGGITAGSLSGNWTLFFAVQPSYYYKMFETHAGGGATPTLYKWIEWVLL